MIEILLLGWLAVSVFMTFVFCTAARWFVSEPDDIEALHRTSSARKQNSVATHHEEYDHNSPYVL